MSLTGVAKETVSIVARGSYESASGSAVDLRTAIARAVTGTLLYRPEDLASLVARRSKARSGAVAVTRIEVTTETTAQAARRLAEQEGEAGAVALNFASAKNPGGGFLGGAKAQEEDLARCSALYECLLTQRAYYDANRAWGSALYTDHMIYSPEVPFFRDEKLKLLDAPFVVSILTAPAPNAGAVWKNHPEDGPQIRSTLEDRAKKLLLVAADRGHRCLILGAWGCGAFHNDPQHVAEVFAVHLASATFADVFDRVIFAIYERGPERPNLAAFRERLG